MNIYDIAKESGVSIATVSRVLNGSTSVSEKTRKKVEEVLKKFNYSPSAIARGLVAKSMKTIGILTIDIRDIYYAEVAYIIEQNFSKIGYNVILCNTGGDKQEKIDYLNMLAEKKVDGIILVGSVFKDKEIDQYIRIISESIPIVLVNGFIESQNIFSIICDDAYGISMCVNHLCSKGHKDILYFQDANTFSGQSKAQGFKHGMAKNNLEFSESSIIIVHKGLEDASAKVEELLNQDMKFSAIIASEDISAVGVIKKLSELKICVPDGIAVTGFNNSILSLCCTPELTTVDSMMETMGIGAVRILNDVLEGRTTPSKTVITPNLVIRKST